jgi:hypothetical protein
VSDELQTMLILRLRNYTIKDRVAEWYMGAMLALMGLGLAVQPLIFTANPFFAEFLRVARPHVWAAGLLLIGLGRLAALTINGAWRRSPHLRVAMAFLSMFVWYQMSALAWEVKFPNLGVVMYPAMLALEVYCVYFAACDAGLSDEAAKAQRE